MNLRIPQIRVLRALADGPLSRAKLREAIGVSPISGTLTTALNGTREGSSHGPAHPGLISLGLVRSEEVDVDGVTEILHVLTATGEIVLSELSSRKLPAKRSAAVSTNKRYMKD